MARKTAKGGSEDGHIEILRAIWNEMKAVKASLERELATTRQDLGARIDETNARLDAVRTELKAEIGALQRRITDSEMRLAAVTTELGMDVRALSGLIREWRVEHREDRDDIRRRLTRLEEHAGLERSSR